MNAIVPAPKNDCTEDKSTNLGRFMAKRGVLLVKEFREISAVKGEYGGRVSISTLVLSSAKRPEETYSMASNLRILILTVMYEQAVFWTTMRSLR
jgi:hypothetical protein